VHLIGNRKGIEAAEANSSSNLPIVNYSKSKPPVVEEKTEMMRINPSHFIAYGKTKPTS
jgi:hypothetical protein